MFPLPNNNTVPHGLCGNHLHTRLLLAISVPEPLSTLTVPLIPLANLLRIGLRLYLIHLTTILCQIGHVPTVYLPSIRLSQYLFNTLTVPLMPLGNLLRIRLLLTMSVSDPPAILIPRLFDPLSMMIDD